MVDATVRECRPGNHRLGRLYSPDMGHSLGPMRGSDHARTRRARRRVQRSVVRQRRARELASGVEGRDGRSREESESLGR